MSNFHYSNEEKYLKITTYLEDKNDLHQYGWAIDKMKPLRSDLYINKQIGTSGNINLLDGESNNVRGVTNFDKNTLNEGRVFVMDKVHFAFAQEGDSTPVASVNYGVENVPPALRFAHLVVKQNNEILLKLPINTIVNSYENGKKYMELDQLALFIPKHPIDVDIEFPTSLSHKNPDGKELFVSVFFGGFETYSKR